jgi:autotransporter-associated beta strand protein
MALTEWKVGVDGNWNVGAYWTSGRPSAGTDAVIDAKGSYTVSLATAGSANSLAMNAAGAQLLEQPTASLNIVSTFFMEAGTALLNAANTIGSVFQSGGTIVATDNVALGTGLYSIWGGSFIAAANLALANQLDMRGNITFAAEHGKTLDLNSPAPWNLNASNPFALHFGGNANDGTVVWHTQPGSSVTSGSTLAVLVDGGTLQAGDASFDTLLSSATNTGVASGAILDIAGFATTIANLTGTGAIHDGGVPATLTLLAGAFSGQIQDAIALSVQSGTVVLTGANTYGGGTTISSGTLQLGDGGIAGSIPGDIVDNAALVYDHSGAYSQTAGISGRGRVTSEGGAAYTINRAESYGGGTTVLGSSITMGNSSAFGSGRLTLADATLLATTSATLTPTGLAISGTTTIAAAHGKTLTNVSATGTWNLDGSGAGGAHLTIGDAVNNGIVLWNTTPGSSITSPFKASLEVAGGTLKAGDASFEFVTDSLSSVVIDAGAKIDVVGFNTGFENLSGAGTITGLAGTVVRLGDADFAGAITGGVALEVVGAAFLSAGSNYTGGTTIDAGGVLVLGHGGTGGAVPGDITDNGSLFFDHSNKVTVTALISGSGDLDQYGPGTTVINRAETYTGGTNVLGGVLSIGEADAISTGPLAIDSAEFLATATMAIANTLHMSGNSTFAAANGTTLAMNTTNPWVLDCIDPAQVNFGDSNHGGTIVWMSPSGSTIIDINYTVGVSAGTLKAGDAGFSFLTASANSNTVGSAGTIDIAGFATQITGLTGSGVVTNSGAATTLFLYNGNFSGHINGPLALEILGTVTLTGGGTYSGAITIDNTDTLNLADTSARSVIFAGDGTLHVTNAGSVAETLTLTFAGNDVVTGAAGNETFAVGASLTASQQIDAGGGSDTVALNGDYTGVSALTLGASTLLNVETLTFAKSNSYDITSDDATVGAGKTLTLDASALKAGTSLSFDGSAESDGHFNITGGLGSDDLTGGALSDTFVYTLATQSSSTHRDTIHSLNFNKDKFDIPGGSGTITAIDGPVSHTISTGTFDSDLAAATTGNLLAHSAMLVTASAGNLVGHVFLVVDLDGTAGYSAGSDLVVDLAGTSGTLTTSDFV